MKNCKGENCSDWSEIIHSAECMAEHDKAYEITDEIPSCFDRAEQSGRLFDNCRFYNDCKSVKPICCNNPIKK